MAPTTLKTLAGDKQRTQHRIKGVEVTSQFPLAPQAGPEGVRCSMHIREEVEGGEGACECECVCVCVCGVRVCMRVNVRVPV